MTDPTAQDVFLSNLQDITNMSFVDADTFFKAASKEDKEDECEKKEEACEKKVDKVSTKTTVKDFSDKGDLVTEEEEKEETKEASASSYTELADFDLNEIISRPEFQQGVGDALSTKMASLESTYARILAEVASVK